MLREKLALAAALISEGDCAYCWWTWPIFSATSFVMVTRLRREGIQPLTILDVGANVGQFGVAAAKRFPKATVHSYEPLPQCFRRLQKASTQLPNLHVHQMALGEAAGSVPFTINSHSHSSSVLPLLKAHTDAFPHAAQTGRITVPMSTLDEQCGSLPLRAPVLLKIDVQGYEDRVLKGGTRILRQIDYIVAETSFQPLYQGELVFMELAELLRGLGFRFARPISFLAHPRTGELLQMDALFVRSK